ncbi:submaxillary gland androgen-regulated protein 3B-like [Drosophila novamexicana]|uniref:Uncharacterized protein n=1 Tax=Drosophila virilis TaxID=7244 RepID=B4M3H0_DROVI|nr:submaxillary gland androgen-regulated protein 3B [Drosophila virilis]XP_030563153.1 submaxillary gland androgen-regulated protein 3B [Drosophila novamexicana]XP_030567677.1 submaxillary gland androgen-regulated protein 3B-like [Drosophila novamexicana]EDW65345.2 uncharacterized protein Dvir_GJ18959 [Drosophila virilis]
MRRCQQFDDSNSTRKGAQTRIAHKYVMLGGMGQQFSTGNTAGKMRLSLSYFLGLLMVLVCGTALVTARPQGPCGPPPSGPPPSGPPPSGPPPGGRCPPPPSTTASSG